MGRKNAGKAKGYTPEGARRSATAGAANLAMWKSKGGLGGLRHGLYSLARTGKISHAHEETVAEVDAIIQQMELELGEPDQLTSTEKSLLARQRLSLLVVRLGSAHIARHGIAKAMPCIEFLVQHANALHRNALALERGRKAKPAPVPSLDDIVREVQAGQNRGDA